eukprot:RCo020588
MRAWLHLLCIILTVGSRCGSAAPTSGTECPPVPRPCQCSVCQCSNESAGILHRAFENKAVYFYGDSVSMYSMLALASQLSGIQRGSSRVPGPSPGCIFNCTGASVRADRRAEPFGNLTRLHMDMKGWQFLDSSQKKAKAGARPEFPILWSDLSYRVLLSRTTLRHYFCTTPRTLLQKLTPLLTGKLRPLPDIVVLNVGLWSVAGPAHSERINEDLVRRRFSGQLDVPPPFVLEEFQRTLLDVLSIIRDRVARLSVKNRRARRYVAFRDYLWAETSAKATVETIRALNSFLVTHFASQRPGSALRLLSENHLSSLPCCKYRDPSHPDQDCLSFLNFWLAKEILNVFLGGPA